MAKASLGNKTKEKSILKKELKKHRGLLVLMIPGFLALLIFKYLPMFGIVIAFKDYKILDGIWGSEWVGLHHFKELFGSSDFLHVLRNTLMFSITKMIFGLPMPIIFALLLNEVKNILYKKTIQTVSYMPHFFSWVMLGGIIKLLFSNTGPINSVLAGIGLNKRDFFANETAFFWMIIGSAVWAGLGWGAIIYMAALSGIDETLYEAASIDGAGKWKQVTNITIPCLVPTIVVVMILNLGSVMAAGFDQIYNLQNPLVYNISEILETYNLKKMQSTDYSYGTAVGLFTGVVGMILVLGTNALSKKVSDNGLW